MGIVKTSKRSWLDRRENERQKWDFSLKSQMMRLLWFPHPMESGFWGCVSILSFIHSIVFQRHGFHSLYLHSGMKSLASKSHTFSGGCSHQILVGLYIQFVQLKGDWELGASPTDQLGTRSRTAVTGEMGGKTKLDSSLEERSDCRSHQNSGPNTPVLNRQHLARRSSSKPEFSESALVGVRCAGGSP